LESIAALLGLVTQRGTLKSIPGSIHWHFKLPSGSGTLEATWDPKGKRIWLAVHENREADWIESCIETFAIRWNSE
jgi:hypothetical protein